jgi:hypothetical protein
MSNTRTFTDFDSPDAGVTLGTTEAGVLTTDTLEKWREKTNGIIEKIKTIDTDISSVKAGGINTNALALDKTQQISGKKLLGNTGSSTANVGQVSIITESDKISSNDNDTSIPTSAAVNDLVSNRYIAAYVGDSVGKALHGCSVSKISTGQYRITVSSDFDVSGNNERYVVNATIAHGYNADPTVNTNAIQDVYTISTYQETDTQYRVRVYEYESYAQEFSDDANNCAMMSLHFRDVPFQFHGVPATNVS